MWVTTRLPLHHRTQASGTRHGAHFVGANLTDVPQEVAKRPKAHHAGRRIRPKLSLYDRRCHTRSLLFDHVEDMSLYLDRQLRHHA